MGMIEPSDVEVGLVVFLDVDVLKRSGQCRCSAWLTSDKDHAIDDPHYFMILNFIDEEEGWLMVPLSAHDGPNRGKLDPDLKSGFQDQWTKGDYFYYQRQFWKAPTDVIVEASFRDRSIKDDRRHFATGKVDEIDAIIAWSTANRNPFRVMNVLSATFS